MASDPPESSTPRRAVRAADPAQIESIVQRHDEEHHLPRRKLVRARPPAPARPPVEAGTPDLDVLRRKFLGAAAVDATDDDDCEDEPGTDAAEPSSASGGEPLAAGDDDDDVASERFEPETPDVDEPGHDPRVVLVSKTRGTIIGEQG